MESKAKKAGNATLSIDGKSIELPVYKGSVGPDVIDIRSLYAKTGAFTYDPGFTSTAACDSTITYIDGDKGELWYRGYPIEQLALHGHHLETAYLLLYGDLPTPKQMEDFENRVTRHTMVHEQMHYFFRGFRRDSHPMATMVGVVGALACVIGWGSEAVILTWGMRDEAVDNEVALQIRETTSAVVYLFIVAPIAGVFGFTLHSLAHLSAGVVALAGLAGTASYLFYYKALSAIGASPFETKSAPASCIRPISDMVSPARPRVAPPATGSYALRSTCRTGSSSVTTSRMPCARCSPSPRRAASRCSSSSRCWPTAPRS